MLFVQGGREGRREATGCTKEALERRPLDICFDWRCPLEDGDRVAGTSMSYACVSVWPERKRKKKIKGMSISESASKSLSFFTQTIYLFIQLNEFNHLFPLGLAGLPVCFKHLAVVFKKKGCVGGVGVVDT